MHLRPGQNQRWFRILIALVALTSLVAVTTMSIHQAPHAKAATTGSMGVNLDGVNEWSPSYMFTDVIKQGRYWGPPDRPYDPPVPVDSNGWPTTDSGIIVLSLDSATNPAGYDASGTYKLSFNGQATVQAIDGSGVYTITVSNQTYNSSTNTTTADVTLPAGDVSLWLIFRNTRRTSSSGTNTGVTNVKCIRPGYPADGSQFFTTPFLNALAPFQTFRTMDLTATNNSNIVNWSDRPKVTDGTQTVNGVAWEYIIALANQVNKDAWINIPHQATDDYVTQLATLFKNQLHAGLHVYVEYSNEVWNYGFQQASWNLNAAQNDPSLTWDGATDQYQIATRRVGKRIAEISNIFKNVWGAAAINTTIRPVLAWQIGGDWGMQEQLNTIQHIFGTPSNYIYALATAPYMHEGDGYGTSQDTSSVDAIINGLYADSDHNLAAMQSVTNLAHSNGLKSLTYEGGTHTPGTTDLTNRINANRDPRMKDLLLHDIGTNWFGNNGGDMYMYYDEVSSYNQYGMWGLSESIFDTNTPKWQAIKQLSAGGGSNPTPTPTNTPTPTPGGGTLPAPWQTQDIGSVGVAGSATVTGSTFTVQGSGADIWGTSDAFRYVYQPLNGDGTIIAQVSNVQNTDGWAKAGVMIRESLTATSTHVFIAISSSFGSAFQQRSSTGGDSGSVSGPNVTAPYWVKLVRSGTSFTGSVSSDGQNWTQVGSVSITMASSVYIGLAVTAHNNSALNTSTFANVSVSGSGSSVTWTKCADENGTCTFSGTAQVRYGANGTYYYKTATGSIGCNNSVFGDPVPGTVKECDYRTLTVTSYEAEASNNTLAGGAQVVSCSYCSGSNRVGYLGQSGTLQWNGVTANQAGSVTLTIYYIDGDVARTGSMSINGGSGTTVSFPSTGNWNTLGTVTLTISVQAGTNTIKFSNPTAYLPDFDRITIAQ